MTAGTHDTTTGRSAVFVACAFVSIAVLVFRWCDAQPWRWMDSSVNAGLLKVGIWVLPSLALAMLAGRSGVWRALVALGLTSRPINGLALGLAATMPMGLAALASGTVRPTTDVIVGAALVGPFAEEVLFRGLLLHTLVRCTRWRTGWSILACALAFGAAHVAAPGDPSRWAWLVVFGPRVPGGDPAVVALAQAVPFAGADVVALLGQIVMPAAAGIVFGWLVVRTGSVWPAVALHGGLNFWSVLAHGPGSPAPAQADATSIAQAVSLLLAILLAEASADRRGAGRATSVQRS